MKNKVIKFSLFTFAFLSLLTSCNEDDNADIARKGKPVLTLENNKVTAIEGDNASLKFKLSYPIDGDAEVRIEVIGGTAIEGVDYQLNIDTMDDAGGGFFGGNGYYYSFDGSMTSVDFSDLETLQDLDNTEGPETIVLKLFSAGKGRVIVDQIVTVTID
jgi:hypothetical protein